MYAFVVRPGHLSIADHIVLMHLVAVHSVDTDLDSTFFLLAIPYSHTHALTYTRLLWSTKKNTFIVHSSVNTAKLKYWTTNVRLLYSFRFSFLNVTWQKSGFPLTCLYSPHIVCLNWQISCVFAFAYVCVNAWTLILNAADTKHSQPSIEKLCKWIIQNWIKRSVSSDLNRCI